MPITTEVGFTASGSFGDKPTLTFPAKTGPPAKTTTKILTQGTGKVVAKNDLLVADYLGQVWGGKVFDNSYDRKAPTGFTIGAGKVIPGWDSTLVGVKAGSPHRGLPIRRPTATARRPAAGRHQGHRHAGVRRRRHRVVRQDGRRRPQGVGADAAGERPAGDRRDDRLAEDHHPERRTAAHRGQGRPRRQGHRQGGDRGHDRRAVRRGLVGRQARRLDLDQRVARGLLGHRDGPAARSTSSRACRSAAACCSIRPSTTNGQAATVFVVDLIGIPQSAKQARG